MLFKKRTKQIYLAKEDTRELKEQEQRPWILEDIEGQNNFTGTLEGGQRSDYVFFVLTVKSHFYLLFMYLNLSHIERWIQSSSS
jgi:transcription initiation factor TFIIF subunit alpha